MWLVLIVICIVGTLRHETFLTPENLFNVLRHYSMLGLLSLGMLMTMLSGGIDLSLGAMLAAGAVIAAAFSEWGGLPAAALAVAATTALGAVTGITIAWGRVQPFITTLVMNMAEYKLTNV